MKRPFTFRHFVLVLCLFLAIPLLCSGCEENQEEKLREQLSQAQTHLDNQEYPKAQEILEQLLADFPEDPRAYGLLSDLYLMQNDWKNAQDILEKGLKNASKPGSLPDKQKALQEKIKQQETSAAVLQPVVSYWGSTYFWKYSAASVQPQNPQAEYAFLPQAENQLVRRSEDGKEQVLYTGPGSGSLLIFDDRVYFSAGENRVGALPASGGEASFYENASLAGCDLSSGKLLLSSGDTLESMDSQGNRTEIAQGTLLSAENGVVYFQSPPEETGRRVSLCSVKTDGSAQTLLAQVRIDPERGESGICQVQVMEDTLYFSEGLYRKKDGLFEQGTLCSVKLDGSGFSSRFPLSSPVFSLYRQDGVPMLRYPTEGAAYRSPLPTGTPSSLCYNLESGASSTSSMPCGPIGRPFTDGRGNLWIYPDLSGTPTQLLSASEKFLSTGQRPHDIQQDGAAWYTVSEPCLAGGYLYFTAIESAYDHAGDASGGASSFRRVSSRFLRKSLSTGETELLYSY